LFTRWWRSISMEYSWRTGLFSTPTGWLELLEFGVHLHYWGDQDEVCTVQIPGCKAARLALRHSEM
jgi:hypothetical protein